MITCRPFWRVFQETSFAELDDKSDYAQLARLLKPQEVNQEIIDTST
jgi:hypothetical protein